MVQLTYYEVGEDPRKPDPTWEPRPDDVYTLRWGFHLTDLDRLARMALSRSYGWAAGPADRYEMAWSAIAETLYAADRDPPDPRDLIAAGARAVADQARAVLHDQGVSAKVGGLMARYVSYWEWVSASAPSPEGQVVDRIALRQIWPQLSDQHRRYLGALAAHGTHKAAAAALGVTPNVFAAALSKARRAFYALWHQHERPSQVWGSDVRSARGRPVRGRSRSLAQGRRGRPTVPITHGTVGGYSRGCSCRPCTAARTAVGTRNRRAKGVGARRRATTSQVTVMQARRQAGESIASVAADLGFSKSYVHKLLTGAAMPVPDPREES